MLVPLYVACLIPIWETTHVMHAVTQSHQNAESAARRAATPMKIIACCVAASFVQRTSWNALNAGWMEPGRHTRAPTATPNLSTTMGEWQMQNMPCKQIVLNKIKRTHVMGEHVKYVKLKAVPPRFEWRGNGKRRPASRFRVREAFHG